MKRELEDVSEDELKTKRQREAEDQEIRSSHRDTEDRRESLDGIITNQIQPHGAPRGPSRGVPEKTHAKDEGRIHEDNELFPSSTPTAQTYHHQHVQIPTRPPAAPFSMRRFGQQIPNLGYDEESMPFYSLHGPILEYLSLEEKTYYWKDLDEVAESIGGGIRFVLNVSREDQCDCQWSRSGNRKCLQLWVEPVQAHRRLTAHLRWNLHRAWRVLQLFATQRVDRHHHPRTLKEVFRKFRKDELKHLEPRSGSRFQPSTPKEDDIPNGIRWRPRHLNSPLRASMVSSQQSQLYNNRRHGTLSTVTPPPPLPNSITPLKTDSPAVPNPMATTTTRSTAITTSDTAFGSIEGQPQFMMSKTEATEKLPQMKQELADITGFLNSARRRWSSARIEDRKEELATAGELQEVLRYLVACGEGILRNDEYPAWKSRYNELMTPF